LVLDMKTGAILVPESRETALPAAERDEHGQGPGAGFPEARLQPCPPTRAPRREVPAAIRDACLERLRQS